MNSNSVSLKPYPKMVNYDRSWFTLFEDIAVSHQKYYQGHDSHGDMTVNQWVRVFCMFGSYQSHYKAKGVFFSLQNLRNVQLWRTQISTAITLEGKRGLIAAQSKTKVHCSFNLLVSVTTWLQNFHFSMSAELWMLESDGEAGNLPVDLHSHPHLWS